MAGARYAQHGTVFEIELVRAGTLLVERRFGTEVTRDEQRYPTDLAATRAYYERTAELLETRWRRISACEIEPERAPHPALTAAAASGDPAARAVYHDWLLEHGDACGELAALRAVDSTPEVARRIDEVERERGVELYGLLAVLGPAWWAQFELGWRDGWIESITARHVFMTDGRAMTTLEARTALHSLLHAPMSRFVRHLVLDDEFLAHAEDDLERCPHLRGIDELTLLGRAPSLQELQPRLPGLRRISLLGGIRSLGHAGVESMVLTIRPDAPAWLLGRWPALRSLELRLERCDRGVVDSVTRLLRNGAVRGIRELRIVGDRALGSGVFEGLFEGDAERALRTLVIAVPLRRVTLELLQVAAPARGFQLVLP